MLALIIDSYRTTDSESTAECVIGQGQGQWVCELKNLKKGLESTSL